VGVSLASGTASGGEGPLAVGAGVATLSKGFWLFLVMLLLWRSIGVPAPGQLLAMALAGCGLAWSVTALQLEGPWVHVGGLTSALQHLVAVAWLGEGVGSAGNYTNDAVEIGDGTRVDSHVVIHGPTRIGRDNRIHSFAAIGGDPANRTAVPGRMYCKIPASTSTST
jgi:hypothetical protein